MSQDIERLLNEPPDNYECTLFRAEDMLLRVEERIRHSAQISRLLDASYDLLLANIAEDADDADTEIVAKTRSMVREYRACRDASMSGLLANIAAAMLDMHESYNRAAQ